MSFDASLEPHDLVAEQSTLGAMLQSAAAVEACLPTVSVGDFYRPAHQLVYEAILGIVREGRPADATTVLACLMNDGKLELVGGGAYLHTLIATCPVPANVAHYAAIVRGHAVRRRLIAAGRRIIQRASGSGETDAHGLADAAVRELEQVRDFELGDDDVNTPTIGEFLAVEDTEYDWIIPNLLERGDRLVLTGMEGLGKSTLFRQIAVTTAAGIHPFNHTLIAPRRVLIVDCENTATHVRRKLRPLITQAESQGRPIEETNLWVEIRPEGLDLARDRDVSWLLRRVALIKPDLVAIGPLYRLAPRALNSDDDAAPILAALNMVRARGACVLLEAHAGHAIGPGGRRDLRPRGSSALLGWPEFGYGIRRADCDEAKVRRVVDVESWRGDRDEREWPERLAAGGIWPWTERAIDPNEDDGWTPTRGLRRTP
ncbi:DnaB-like helicase N-terminal domain-containing protein [Nonomuraea sp. NPDC050786]|uniref:DnaB-like helicase N-terminal domain-containing protein n=1 Tax=Nonomuraea sp. NPDC050786 TaxID=3154840 RepID=UPI0033F4FDDA